MRAANLVLVKESLTSRVSILHTQRTYTHSQVEYLDAHVKWVCAVCKPGEWTHAISISCAWHPVYVCVCYSCHRNLFFSLLLFLSWLSIFPSSRLPELSPIWKCYFHFQFRHHLPASPWPWFLMNYFHYCLSFVSSFFFKCSTLWKQSYDWWGDTCGLGCLTKNEGIYFKGQCSYSKLCCFLQVACTTFQLVMTSSPSFILWQVALEGLKKIWWSLCCTSPSIFLIKSLYCWHFSTRCPPRCNAILRKSKLEGIFIGI